MYISSGVRGTVPIGLMAGAVPESESGKYGSVGVEKEEVEAEEG